MLHQILGNIRKRDTKVGRILLSWQNQALSLDYTHNYDGGNRNCDGFPADNGCHECVLVVTYHYISFRALHFHSHFGDCCY